MKLFEYVQRKDFGRESILTVLKFKKYSLLQLSVSWDDYKSFPYFQLSFGLNSLFDILFFAYRFSFNLVLFGRNWK